MRELCPTLEFDFQEDVFLPFHHEHMDLILGELIQNAQEAISKSKKKQPPGVNISLTKVDQIHNQIEDNSGGYAVLCVEDNGIGMSPCIRKKIFDPYFSLKDKGTQKGMGLSLALVDTIVTQHYGGKIVVQSQEGVGTTMKIYFPRSSTKDVHSWEVPEPNYA
mgnify:CR=1 FL=1